MTFRLLHLIMLTATAAGAATALPAAAPETRLERCGTDTCLRFSGIRSDAQAAVLVAGHEVAVSGRRHWHASLPLDRVRQWLTPSARAIGVRVAGGGEVAAALPVGLLGHATEMAFLDVRATR
jgi:hypothetical protein